MLWKTSPLRPRRPLEVEYRGERYIGWISDIFRAIGSRHASSEERLHTGWEDEVWERLHELYPYYITRVKDPKDAPLTVSIATVRSFLNFIRKRGWNRELVSSELAEKRAAVCSVCPKAAVVSGCGLCKALARQIVKTPDSSLVSKDKSGCTACGCLVEVKVWIPFSQLKETLGDHDWSDSCWMRSESLELNSP